MVLPDSASPALKLGPGGMNLTVASNASEAAVASGTIAAAAALPSPVSRNTKALATTAALLTSNACFVLFNMISSLMSHGQRARELYLYPRADCISSVSEDAGARRIYRTKS